MKLSKITEIPPRRYWKNESSDFTPWLAEEDNIALLSEAISLDLEVVSREEKIDGGRADLLCIESGTERNVIIENQLEKTDPDHLGRILSYASALNANTIIWIATEFDEQYRATVDWLNRVTGEEFNFFGIEIHLLQIGDSDYAPQFKVVAKPNDWQKRIMSSSKVDERNWTDTKNNQKQYWEEFASYMEAHPSKYFHTTKPSPQPCMNIATGRSNFYVSLCINSKENKNTVQFCIENKDPKTTFDTLLAYKLDSQKDISPDIDWLRQDNIKRSMIQLSVSFDFMDTSSRQAQFEWFREFTEKFIIFFKDKIKNL